jgi:hypothetical protein
VQQASSVNVKTESAVVCRVESVRITGNEE